MPSRAGRSFDSDTGSSGKERLKWNDELHDLFEKAVNQLGGPDSKFRNHNYGVIWFWFVSNFVEVFCG